MQQACNLCHRRKSRCDKVQPTCGYCQRVHAKCVYTDRSKEPTYRRDHVEAMERRLRQAEAKNKALSSELAKVRSLPTVDSSQSSTTVNTLATGDIINEVSFLASTAAGERHYLGSTSGVLFADLLRASVDISTHIRPSPSKAESAQRFNNSPSNTLPPASEILPSQELAKKLISSYLAHDHLCYPSLSPRTVCSIVDSMYDDPSFYSRNAFEGFVFDMLLAIATANVYKFDWQILPSAETHHLRAMSRITEVFQAGGTKSLQVILLLCQYRTGSSMQDTSASMWHLVGIAVRISYELGLHRESTYSLNGLHSGSSEYLARMTDGETRRRCFWCIFAMDRIVGITLGRPLAINLDDIDVELPSPSNDHIFNMCSEGDEDPSSFNRTSIFVHITQYRHLCGRIMRSLHGLKREGYEESQVIAQRDSYAAELDQWRQKTRGLHLPEVDLLSASSEDQSSFRSKEWYELIYNNAMLLIFRPSPMLADITRDSGTLQKIFLSAKQAITIYSYLHRSRNINYSWITLHSVFMAGLSYIYAVSRHFRARRQATPAGDMLASDPSTIEIVNDTRACSNVLVGVSERWNALRHCHEVFHRLSDAVLADAIKLQCRPDQTQKTSMGSMSGHPITTESVMDAQIAYTPANGNLTTPSRTGNGFQNAPPAIPTFDPNSSPLAVDSEFHSHFDDLQQLYDGSYVDDPFMQLSQEWLGYISDSNPIFTTAG